MNIKPDQLIELLKKKEELEKEESLSISLKIPEVPKEITESSLKHTFPKPPKEILELAKTKKYNYKFHENFKSFICDDHKFSNYLNKFSDEYHLAVANVVASIENDGVNLPFSMDEEHLNMTTRIIGILEYGSLYEDIKERSVSKSTYVEPLEKGLHNPKENQLVRIYFCKEKNNVEIILIDLYHLLATTKMKEISKKFVEVYNYRNCINTYRKVK